MNSTAFAPARTFGDGGFLPAPARSPDTDLRNAGRVSNHTFSTTSDDGSWLLIDGQMVVGYHSFEVQFFQGGGGSGLDVGLLANVTLPDQCRKRPPLCWPEALCVDQCSELRRRHAHR